MILYLDTSSFLKLFLEEEGSAIVERLVRESTRVVTSLVAYAEARAGVAKATRLGRLDEGAYRTAVIGFEQKWSNIHAVAVDTDLVRSAGNLAESHGLRGFDAVHLASALFFARESVEAMTFSAWDDRLIAAAEAEGLTSAREQLDFSARNAYFSHTMTPELSGTQRRPRPAGGGLARNR